MRWIVITAVVAGGSSLAQQQAPNPFWMQQTCGNIAFALTVGDQRAAMMFGMQAKATIGAQTMGSGYYPALGLIGTPHTTIVGGAQPVMNGFVFTCQTYHQRGYANWFLGYSNLTGLIEFISFNTFNQPVPAPFPMPQPAPAPSADPAAPKPVVVKEPEPPPAPKKPTKSEACEKFPALC